MRKFYLTLLFVSFYIISFSQATLSVTLKSDKNKAFNSTVQLLQLPDSNIIYTRTVQYSTSFDVKHNTIYLLRITAAETNQIEREIAIADSSVSVTIEQFSKTTNLGNVVVVARKPLVTQEDDKTIVDAEVLASSSTNAYEILEKTPGAVVDQDGNVYLNSATPANIQINGRDVKLSAADLASLLKSLPANSVVKIEILRSPSAKYDASGGGGIVNIVLRKGVKIGMNGSANISYFQGKYSTLSAGFNINKTDKKVNSYFSYNLTNRKNFETLRSERFINFDSVLNQESYTVYPSVNNYFGGGLDIAVNDKLTIGYDGRLVLNNNDSRANNTNTIYNYFNGLEGGINKGSINNNSGSSYFGNNFNSKYKLDTLGSEWTNSVDINFFNSDNEQDYVNSFALPAKPHTRGDGTIDNNKNLFVAQTDFIFKLKSKYTIETGAKLNISNSRNNSAYFIDSSNTGRVTDIFQTNRFRYKETISSLYLQVAKTIFGFTIKPGVRMETTNISGQQLFPFDTSLSIKRTDFFPYVYLRHNLFKMMGFTLTGNAIYRKSITRPYYEILNPYPRFIDTYLRDVGNPNLRPQFTTNYEFNVMADDIPVISIGVNDTKDIFTNVTYADSASKIAYRTYDNLGKNKETYYRVLGGIPPGGKYFFYVGAQYNHVHYQGKYRDVPFQYKRGSWLFFMYQNYKPTPEWNISMHGFMRLKGLQNFYEIREVGSVSLSFNRSMLKKKANLILSFNDIFLTNRYKFSINQAGIIASGERYNDTRRAGLTFRYNFGIKPKEDKQQQGFGVPAESSN